MNPVPEMKLSKCSPGEITGSTPWSHNHHIVLFTHAEVLPSVTDKVTKVVVMGTAFTVHSLLSKRCGQSVEAAKTGRPPQLRIIPRVRFRSTQVSWDAMVLARAAVPDGV